MNFYKTAWLRFRVKLVPLCGGGKRLYAEGFGYGVWTDFRKPSCS